METKAQRRVKDTFAQIRRKYGLDIASDPALLDTIEVVCREYTAHDIGSTEVWSRVSSQINVVLHVPLPPFDTDYGNAWLDQVGALGRNAIPVLILWLRDGNDDEQTVALYMLRLLCGNAWGNGYGPDTYYEITVDGTPILIRPETKQVIFNAPVPGSRD